MAAPATLPALLASLTQSLSLALEATPKLQTIPIPADGVSLLDVKNELLLAYLQNLVFLILVKLRNAKPPPTPPPASAALPSLPSALHESVRAKLVQLRLYLEKGARPLEEKLRFSIDRLLRLADDAQSAKRRPPGAAQNGNSPAGDVDDSDSESESNSSASATEDDESDQDDDGNSSSRVQKVRRQGGHPAGPRLGMMVDDVTARPAVSEADPSGLYRPPKRERQVMKTGGPREKSERRPHRSHTMEEFIHSELSTVPMAEPSIGTTILQGGRKVKTAEERKEEAERREYEETNLVRLPKESKKDRAKKNKQAGRSGRIQFGGEEWRDLGEGVDRIDRLTRRKGPAGAGVRAMLEQSRKRTLGSEDGPRASGHGTNMGEHFRKRVKMMDGGRRGRGKKR